MLVSGSAVDVRARASSVTLTGHVTDLDRSRASAGATVSVVPSGGVGPVAHRRPADAAGSYSVALDAGVPVDLEIDPPSGALLCVRARPPRRHRRHARRHAARRPSTSRLPKGLQISGFVRGPNGAPLAGVTVDLLCLSCGDPTPLAHADSDFNRAYSVARPDPGLANVDGGGQDLDRRSASRLTSDEEVG